jgi:hypothetical protein
MFRVAFAIALSSALAACASPFFGALPGRINEPVQTVWVSSDTFIYVPGPEKRNFVFETANGRIIAPGLMYTDGGSIPRIAQIFKAFSPWGYGPAYIVHDWIFYAQHCDIDRFGENQDVYNDAKRFADVYGYGDYGRIDFHESAQILAEVVKTMIDREDVRPQNVPAVLISSAVDSVFALALWNEAGACERQRVKPQDIAIVWVRLNDARQAVPETWKLSPWEIAEASKHVEWARKVVRTIEAPRKTRQPPIPSGDRIASVAR